jgi:hypothetical protein
MQGLQRYRVSSNQRPKYSSDTILWFLFEGLGLIMLCSCALFLREVWSWGVMLAVNSTWLVTRDSPKPFA